MRGGERVLEVLCNVFPQADLFTLTWDPARLSPELARRGATTSAIHRFAQAPFVRGRFRGLLPLFPLAVESFKLDRYSLVVSSSHCVAMGAIAPPSALHVAYMHSTLRYVREAQPTYEASIPGGPLGRAVFRTTAHYLRSWETAAAARPDLLIANSRYTRERIRGYYQRDAQVIEPPIETTRFEQAALDVRAEAEAPFLLVSALVPNKRVDLALRAFQGRRERLVILGEGPERARLERLAGPNVQLVARVDDQQLTALYAGCRALLHTGVDDFGMVMVEALAAGKPVLACAEGGALDIVRDGETGLLIDEPTVTAVRAALDRFAQLGQHFQPAALQAFARQFDRTNFERRFAQAVDDAWRVRHDASSNGTRNGHPKTHPPPANGQDATHATTKMNGVDSANGGHATASGHETHHANGSNGAHLAPGHGAARNGAHTHGGLGNGALTNGAHARAPHANGVHGPHVDGPSPHHGNGANGHAPNGLTGEGIALPDAPKRAPLPARTGPDPQVIQESVAGHPSGALVAKRILDVTLAASGLVMAGPLLAALGALIPLDSQGPALFFQRRTGIDQKPFTLVKLRTMNEAGEVTRLGRLLRPLGLDELPQLWNVLRGDMSLIGPRPEIPDRVDHFERRFPGYRARHFMRPGITGLAQVNGLRGNKSPIDVRLRFDLQYLREWSLALDGRILLRTVGTVLGDALREIPS